MHSKKWHVSRHVTFPRNVTTKLHFLFIFTARKRSLGQGNIFAPVCHSVHRGGVHGQVPPGQVHHPGQVNPSAGTPPGRYPQAGIPPSQVHPLDRYPRQVHPKAGTPQGRYTPRQVHPLAGTPPPRQVHPPGRVHPPLGRYTPLWAGTPPRQVHPLHAGIRSTSGRYAPYWNAFLLYLCSKIYFHRVFRKIAIRPWLALFYTGISNYICCRSPWQLFMLNGSVWV